MVSEKQNTVRSKCGLRPLYIDEGLDVFWRTTGLIYMLADSSVWVRSSDPILQQTIPAMRRKLTVEVRGDPAPPLPSCCSGGGFTGSWGHR